METEKNIGETIITFGKHNGKKISELPKEYLVDFYKGSKNSKKEKHKALIEYIESGKVYIFGLTKTYQNQIDFRAGGIRGQMVCKDTDKIIFISEKDAKNEIKRITNVQSNNKKPKRAYECDKCSGWHLTSISYEDKIKNFKK